MPNQRANIFLKALPNASAPWCALWLGLLWCWGGVCWALGVGAGVSPPVTIKLQFPTGGPETILTGDGPEPPAAAALPGSEISGLLILESNTSKTLYIESNFGETGEWKASVLYTSQLVQSQGEIMIQSFTLDAPDEPIESSRWIQIYVHEGSSNTDPVIWKIEKPLTIDSRESETGNAILAIPDIEFPCDAQGRSISGKLADAIVMPGSLWRGLTRIFAPGGDAGEPAGYSPRGYIGVTLKNPTQRSMTVFVEAGPVSAGDGTATGDETAGKFAYNWWQEKPTVFKQLAVATVPADSQKTVALPLFAAPDVSAGEYRMPVTVKLSGMAEKIAVETYRFRVLRPRGGVALYVLALAILTGTGVLALPSMLRRTLRRLAVRHLTLIALFGAMVVAGALLLNVVIAPLQGLLGPFNAFVGGFFYRLMMAALWVSLLALLPYRGVVTLTALVGYLLGGIFFGAFNPMDLILVGSGIIFKEGMLWALGVTKPLPKNPVDLMKHGGGAAKVTAGFLLRVGLALGVAEAASTWTSLALQMVFYRLYFPGWYIAAVTVVQSFGFMLIGVWAARRLARLVHRISAPSL